MNIKVPYGASNYGELVQFSEKPEARTIDIQLLYINLGLFGVSGSSVLLSYYFPANGNDP